MVSGLLSQCPAGFIIINNNCYFENDLVFLEDIITQNDLTIDDCATDNFTCDENNDGIINPLHEIGSQNWLDGRLTGFAIGNYSPGKWTTISIIPESISFVTSLGYLDLTKNKIETIPASLSSLTQLSFLSLHENKITNIPSFIYELTNLSFLAISHNFITNISEDISNLTSLIWLYLDNNGIQTLPESICELYIDWFGSFNTQNGPIPYFLYESNFLCENLPGCIDTATHYENQYCGDLLAGDTNYDNEINVLDIILTVNLILGLENPNYYEFLTSDMNSDGSIDVLDVVQLVNVILEG